MARLGRVFAAVLTLCALLVTAPAVSAKDTTLYVGCSGKSPNYPTAQAAVDAASAGSTVSICGTVTGPVSINKSITLTGTNNPTIQAPTTSFQNALATLPPQFTSDHLFAPQALVVVWGAGVKATISGLTIAGPMPGNGGCAEDEYGVLILGGASVDMDNDRVLNIRDTNTGLLGCQFGVGIQVGREYWRNAAFSAFSVENFVGHANITGTTVKGYEKNGITVDGSGSTADIRDNTIVGDGRVDYTAQNGVQISRGAAGSVRDNTIRDNAYTGLGFASSGGIITFGGCGDPLVIGVQVKKNTLINNDVGIFLNNYNANCDGPAAQNTNDQADGNTITNDKVTNVSGNCHATDVFGQCTPAGLGAYQVGVNDVGNNDKIINNDISGVGYTPTGNAADIVRPIDTTSFPTTKVKVHANDK